MPLFSDLPSLIILRPVLFSPSLDEDQQTELRDAKLNLAAAKRQAEELKISSESAERAKVEIDIQYRHLSEVTKDQQTEIRELHVRPRSII